MRDIEPLPDDGTQPNAQHTAAARGPNDERPPSDLRGAAAAGGAGAHRGGHGCWRRRPRRHHDRRRALRHGAAVGRTPRCRLQARACRSRGALAPRLRHDAPRWLAPARLLGHGLLRHLHHHLGLCVWRHRHVRGGPAAERALRRSLGAILGHACGARRAGAGLGAETTPPSSAS